MSDSGPLRRDRLVIVDHDPAWATAFERQRGPVSDALREWLRRPVEHIGSTAVPGLAAKPIIDMLAVVGDHRSATEGFPCRSNTAATTCTSSRNARPAGRTGSCSATTSGPMP